MGIPFSAASSRAADPNNPSPKIRNDAILLDIRTEPERKAFHFGLTGLKKVISIPVSQIPNRKSEIPSDKIIAIFCSTGTRAAMVYLYLRAYGYDKVYILEGGYESIVNELKPSKLLSKYKKTS